MSGFNEHDDPTDWSSQVHGLLKQHQIRLVSFVPDAGLSRLITLCQEDPDISTVTLTSEEEGVALSAGSFLGGMRSILLMQSSGVGNCINMLSLPRICNMPFLALVAMRGEWAEFNPWQLPMGQATAAVLESAGVIVQRVESAADAGPIIESAIKLSLHSRQRVAVLLSQRMLGAKSFLPEER